MNSKVNAELDLRSTSQTDLGFSENSNWLEEPEDKDYFVLNANEECDSNHWQLSGHCPCCATALEMSSDMGTYWQVCHYCGWESESTNDLT